MQIVDRAALRALGRLALPIVIVQVGLMFMGVVDTIMVGHVSAAGLGAVALGNLYFFAAAIFGMGVLLALDPVIAQAVGAHDDVAIARAVQRGFVLSLALTVFASLVLPTVGPVLQALRQPGDVVPLARTYVLATIPGVAPFSSSWSCARPCRRCIRRDRSSSPSSWRTSSTSPPTGS